MKDKRKLFVSLVTLMLLFCCSMLFAACNDVGGTSESNPTYMVTFKVDGRNYDIALVEEGKTVTLPAAPEKIGYTFEGWYADEKCTQALDNNAAITANTTVYAKMTPNIYTITYEANGGTNPNAVTTFTVEDKIMLADAEKSGYLFKGWKNGDEYMTAIPRGTTENVTLIATFEKNGYVISYEKIGGAYCQNPKAYAVDDDTFALNGAVKDGYTFDGWYANEDYTGNKVTEIAKGTTGNITLYAKFTLDIGTITYVDAQGVYNDGDTEYSIEQPVYLRGLQKSGYTFLGWFDEYDNKVTVVDFGAFEGDDVTLTAKWTVNTYNITYIDVGNVENVNPATFTIEDETIEIADLNDTLSETFLGWSYMNGTPLKGYTFSAEILSDVELTAVWEKKPEFRGLNYYTSMDGKDIIVTGVTDTSITEITVPDETSLILEGAFKDCTALKSINIPFIGAQKGDTKNTKFSYLFGGDDKIPSTLKNVTVRGGNTIPKEAFKNCSSIETLTLTGDIQTIEQDAFGYCSSLDLLYMQDSQITTIGYQAFIRCERLLLVKLPATLTKIQTSAFGGCSKIVEVYNPSTLNIQLNNWGHGQIAYDAKYLHTSLDEQSKLYFDEKGNLFYDSDEGLSLMRYRSEELTYTIPSNVNIIDDYAFQGRSDMQSIAWSDSIKSIGDYAFQNCGGITDFSVTTDGFNVGEGAFQDCTSITSLTVSAENVVIDRGAFKNCTNLVALSLTGKGLEIAGYVFDGCVLLESIDIKAENSKFNSRVFQNTSVRSVTISADGVWLSNTFCDSTIQDVALNGDNITFNGYVFDGAELLKTVTVNGNNVRFSGNGNFRSCCNLATVTINGTLTEINGSCFEECTSLKSIEFKNGLKSIGNNAFENCTKISSITFNSDLESIGDSVFLGCTALTDVVFNSGLKSIGAEAFKGCTALKTVTFNDNLETIGGNAFNGCTGLITIDLPSSLKTIGAGAFSGCNYLHEIGDLPDGITIGSEAFANCKFFEWIVPVDADNIDNNAFKNCQDGRSDIPVYYEGTREQLDALNNNFGVSGGVYAYSESAPAFVNGSYVGNYWHYNKFGDPEPWNYDVVTLSISKDSSVTNIENTCENLIDGNKGNIYAAAQAFGTIEITIKPSTPVALSQFTLTIGRGADKPGRIPKEFSVSGTNADTGNWETIYSTDNAGFSQQNYDSKTFNISEDNANKLLTEFRFTFKSNGKNSEGTEALTLEWSEIELMFKPIDWSKSEGYDLRYRAIDGDDEYTHTTDGDTYSHWALRYVNLKDQYDGVTGDVIIEANEAFILSSFNLWSRGTGNVSDYDFSALGITKVTVYGSNDDYYQGNSVWNQIYNYEAEGNDYIINYRDGGKTTFDVTDNATAYKYYKFTFKKGGASWSVSSITEIELVGKPTYSVVAGTFSTGNNGKENYDKAADGNTETKWCVDFDTTNGVYVIFEANRSSILYGYTFTTANDNANTAAHGRNPKSWTIYGSNSDDCLNDGYSGWTEVCKVTGNTTMQDVNYTPYSFTVDTTSSYKYFKIVFTENGGNNMLQLSEIELNLR